MFETKRLCVRPALFQTELSDFPVATHGGVITLIEYRNQLFGVTCQHVISDFQYKDVVITTHRNGGEKLRTVGGYFPTRPIDDAIESDLLDLVIFRISKDVDSSKFQDPPVQLGEAELFYIKDQALLRAYGTLKDQTSFMPDESCITFFELQVQYQRKKLLHGILHLASMKPQSAALKNLHGMSGGPIFHEESQQLCGLVLRGGITSENQYRLWFIDIHDVREMLKAGLNPNKIHHYNKLVYH